MTPRHAILEFRNGGRAVLTASGWRTIPFDDVLSELLNSEFSLIQTQRKRRSLTPDLLGCAARRAASALGAEIVKYFPLSRLDFIFDRRESPADN